jgi:hypothetical protein
MNHELEKSEEKFPWFISKNYPEFLGSERGK